MTIRTLRRIVLAARMTLAYGGCFSRRKMWRVYWRVARVMMRGEYYLIGRIIEEHHANARRRAA